MDSRLKMWHCIRIMVLATLNDIAIGVIELNGVSTLLAP